MFNKYKSTGKPSATTPKSITLDDAKPLIERMLGTNETGLAAITPTGYETLKDMLRLSIGYRSTSGQGDKNIRYYSNNEIDLFVRFLIHNKIHCRYIPNSSVYQKETGGAWNGNLIGHEDILEFKDFTDKDQLIDALNQLYPSPEQARETKLTSCRVQI